jgi:hypothetical protein
LYMSKRMSQKTVFSQNEVDLLSLLVGVKNGSIKNSEKRDFLSVKEICESLKTKDTDEITRALFTLEGKSLVEPNPPGDFTSTFWKTTAIGEKALEVMKRDTTLR